MTNIKKFNTKHTWVKVILSKDDRVIPMPFSGGGLTVNIIRRKEAFTKTRVKTPTESTQKLVCMVQNQFYSSNINSKS